MTTNMKASKYLTLAKLVKNVLILSYFLGSTEQQQHQGQEGSYHRHQNKLIVFSFVLLLSTWKSESDRTA